MNISTSSGSFFAVVGALYVILGLVSMLRLSYCDHFYYRMIGFVGKLHIMVLRFMEFLSFVCAIMGVFLLYHSHQLLFFAGRDYDSLLVKFCTNFPIAIIAVVYSYILSEDII